MGNKNGKAPKPAKEGAATKTPTKGGAKGGGKKDEPQSYVFKVLTIGDQAAGKTSLLIRYVRDHFKAMETITDPLEVESLQKSTTVQSCPVSLHIYDTAGQEGFRTITSSYYRGAHFVMIVFDLTSNASFSNLQTWVQEVERYARPRALKMVVGTKHDLESDREVDEETAREFCLGLGFEYIETSSQSGYNVTAAFERACTLMINAIKEGELEIDDSEDS